MNSADLPRDGQGRIRPPDPDRTLPAEGGRTDHARHSAIPASIGDYTILGKLGEGGMGVVYEAEQQNPKRTVALKVVRGGHFVDEVSIKMFQREAETLGRLKHPGIGAIYESGRTDEGQHFFAMELVRGATLDTHIVENDPSVSDRLALFRRICDAVNYAHQRGVIHRDLKPSNIVIDEDGAPKILDFGLARMTDADTQATSMATEVGAIKGTLPYMSPEQARGNPDEIDLRTDVYSLGVILYELLTGARPYDMDKSSILEAVRVIAEESPAAFASATPAAPAANRKSIAAKLAGGELETITRKALEKDPDHRYQSAAALSDDIERHLTNQPILARPPSTIYQLKKLVVRNKLPFAFAGTLVLLLIGFGIWMSVLFARAEIARQESEAVTDFLSNMLAAVDPGEKGRDVTVREVLDEGAKTIDVEFADYPLVRARIIGTMGNVYRALGYYEQGLPLLARSVAIREDALPPDHEDMATSLNNYAAALEATGEYETALEHHERALAIRQKTLGPEHTDVARSMNNLGVLLENMGDDARARTLYEQAMAIYEKNLGHESGEVALCMNNLAILSHNEGDYLRSRALNEGALAIREKVFGPDHPDVAQSLNNLANDEYMVGNLEGARSAWERVLVNWEKTLGPAHPNLAATLHNVAVVCMATGDYDASRSGHERALAIREKAFGPDHADVAHSKNAMGDLLRKTGDLEGAQAHYERALAIRESALGHDHPNVAQSLNSLGSLFREEGDLVRARVAQERALAIMEKNYGPENVNVGAGFHNLASLYREMGEYEAGRTSFQRAQEIFEARLGPDHTYVRINLELHAELLRLMGENEEAESLEARAESIRSKSEPQS